MGLNIKNETTHKLASELAEITGETLTDAVTKALSERLERLKKGQSTQKEELIREVEAIQRRVRANIKGPIPDHAELLYDERGLPK